MKRKNYLLSVLTGLLFLLALWIFSDASGGSSVSMGLMVAYLAVLVFCGWKLTSWDSMKFSAISLITVFLGYKILSIVNVTGDYRQDGFLADYEVGPYETMDLFFLIFLVTTFLMTALVRFALVRKKIRQIPKKTLKVMGISLLIFIALGIVNLFSWTVTKPLTAKMDQYCMTFSREKWEAYPPKRELMLADFLVTHRGITEDELEELLGKPDEKGYFAGYGAKGEIYVSFVFEEDGLQDMNLISVSPFGD